MPLQGRSSPARTASKGRRRRGQDGGHQGDMARETDEGRRRAGKRVEIRRWRRSRRYRWNRQGRTADRWRAHPSQLRRPSRRHHRCSGGAIGTGTPARWRGRLRSVTKREIRLTALRETIFAGKACREAGPAAPRCSATSLCVSAQHGGNFLLGDEAALVGVLDPLADPGPPRRAPGGGIKGAIRRVGMVRSIRHGSSLPQQSASGQTKRQSTHRQASVGACSLCRAGSTGRAGP